MSVIISDELLLYSGLSSLYLTFGMDSASGNGIDVQMEGAGYKEWGLHHKG